MTGDSILPGTRSKWPPRCGSRRYPARRNPHDAWGRSRGAGSQRSLKAVCHHLFGAETVGEAVIGVRVRVLRANLERYIGLAGGSTKGAAIRTVRAGTGPGRQGVACSAAPADHIGERLDRRPMNARSPADLQLSRAGVPAVGKKFDRADLIGRVGRQSKRPLM